MTDEPLPIEARLQAAGLPPLPRTAWLEIDLERLAGNVRAILAALPTGTLVEAVVKANGYGHGAVPIAHAALAAGAHGLCVATLDEARARRRGRGRLGDLAVHVGIETGLGRDGLAPDQAVAAQAGLDPDVDRE